MYRSSKASSRTATSTVKAVKPKVDKEQAAGFLATVPDDKAFYCHDGRIFRNLKDLKEAIAFMGEQAYAFHANDVKKDFANWVRGVICDEQLASDLEKAASRDQAARAIEERYDYLVKKAR
jgi:hypothetical protein